MTSASTRSRAARLARAGALFALLPALRLPAQLPEAPTVVHGDVKVSTTPSQMTVNQTTPHGIVNWNSFSIGTGNGVHFNNGTGATLNRVTGLTASQIDGTLSATGSLFLLNKNGIIIGENGRVLTGGSFVGSTRDIADADFLDGGGFSLFGQEKTGVTNLGKISSTGGNVFLAGYTVANRGEIEAAAGRVGLVAGQRIDVLTDVSWMNGAFAVSLGERGNDVTTSGRLLSLVAELRTHNGNIYALAGNNTGLIQATGVKNEGGKVFLTAEGGTVQSTGTVAATRTDADGRTVGGDIAIAAATVENFGGTQDVSGAVGGTIRITTDAITTDTEMLARGTAGAGGTIAIQANREVLFTSAGVIDASGATAGGEIALGGGAGKVILSGRLAATGGTSGGQIAILGQRLSLLGASVQADGATQGGKIFVGGGYQGGAIWTGEVTSPLRDSANAQRTYISDKTVLSADATGEAGKGGIVIAWADGTTEFAGTITARGGLLSGDGGLVETSGLTGLGVSGTVDASARSGSGVNGQWLLDPKNITIGTLTDTISEVRSVTQSVGARPTDDTQDDIYFGQHLDLSGETLIVGSPRANAAYIFESGQIAARLTANAAYNGSLFGQGVQVEGNIAAVMAGNQGSAYIFAKGTGWRSGQTNLTATLARPFGASNEFGAAVSGITGNYRFRLDNDRGTLMLYAADPGAAHFTTSNVGAVFFTHITSTGNAFGFSGEYRPTNSVSGMRFGDAIEPAGALLYITYGGTAESDDLTIIDRTQPQVRDFPNILPNAFSLNGLGMAARGSTLFIPNRSSSVDMLRFSEPGGNIPIAYLGATSLGLNLTSISNSARAIAVSGNTLVVGDGYRNNFSGGFAAFQEPAGGWASASNLSPVLVRNTTLSTQGPALGTSFAIDGDYLVVGAPLTDAPNGRRDNGTVLQFRRSGGIWTESTTLRPAEPFAASSFGVDVAVSGGTYAIGDAYFGDQASGGSNGGRIYVYENGALAATLSGGIGGPSVGLGHNLALSGNRLASVSVANGGTLSRIHLFDKGTAWRNGTANQVSFFDDASYVQSIALDGTTLAFGAPQAGPNALGKVGVFTNIGSGLSGPTFLRNPLGVAGTADNFGFTIALSGNTLAVNQSVQQAGGASLDAIGNYNVFVFENLANNWATATATRLAAGTILNSAQDSVGFGLSLGLSGNTLAIGYQRDAQVGSTRGVYVFERNGTWAASATPVARLTAPTTAKNFGFDVAVDGTTIAVSSPGSGSPFFVYGGNSNPFSPVFVFQKQGGWRSGSANAVASLLPTASINDIPFGGQIALSGNTLIAGSTSGSGGYAEARPVYVFSGPFDLSGRATFAAGPSANLNISAASLAASLSLGTSITLQANNDITVSSPITVNNPTGNGGNLTLLAGRRILVNASIFTDNGNLTLIAADPRANATYRDGGEKVVVLGRDAGNVGVTLNLGTGNLLINAADRFENRTGSSSPFLFAATNPGRYQVYATTPNQTGAPDAGNLQPDLATAGRNWVYYNKTFNVADLSPAWLPAGNGFIYSVQPSLGVSVGNATLTYGQPVSANLSLTSLTLGGSAVSQTVFGIGSADLPNLVTTGLAAAVPFSTGGFAHAGTYPGGITAVAKSSVTTGGVFGVAVSTGAAGNLTVNKATLTYRPNDATRVYRAANPTFAFTYTGFVTGDTAAVLDVAPSVTTTAVTASNVGTYTLTGTGGSDNNYTLVPSGTGQLTVTAAPLALTGLTAVNRAYDGTTVATFTGTPTIAPLGGDAVSLTGSLTATGAFANRNVGTAKPITLTGFGLSGAQAANYSLVLPNLTAAITPAQLTLAGLTAQSRMYDGTRTATLTGTAAIVPFGTDVVTLSGTPTATFADKNAGTAKPVTVAGLTLGGTDAANYQLAASSLTAAITPRPLAVTGVTAANRAYNATTVAPLAGTAAIAPLAGDTVTLGGTASASFADKHVGTAKPVTVFGYTLTGADAANYALSQPVGLTANITPAALTLSGLTIASRVYDATATAVLSGTAAIAPLGTDQVTLVGTAAATFADKHVGTAKPATLTGLTLGGADSGNYTLLPPAGLAGTITARPLTVSGLTAQNKIYDATTVATVTGTPSFSGILPGDAATINAAALSFAFADKNVGTAKPLAVTGVTLTGADAANYQSAQFGLTASITPAPLSVAGATAASRVYNATTAVTVTGGTLQGLLGTDAVVLGTTGAAGTFADKHAGTAKPVTVTGYTLSGADVANYTLQQPAGLTAAITPFTLSLVGLSANKTYDGSTAAPLTFTGLNSVFSGDVVTATTGGVTGTYADKNAAANKAVTLTGLFGLTGADAANYQLTPPTALVGTIAPRPVAISGLTVADKVYDGTTAAVVAGTPAFGSAVPGDILTVNVAAIGATFADKNAGTNKAVTLTGVVLAGADAANYTTTAPAGLTASILAKDVTVAGVTAASRVYNATTVATLTGGTLQGVLGGELVTLSTAAAAGAFADKNVGTAKPVTATGYAISGADAANYTLKQPTGLTAAITPFTVGLVGLSGNKTYDGTTAAPLTATGLSSVFSGDVVTVNTGAVTGTYADKNAAANKPVTLTGLFALAGADAANYLLTQPTSLTGTIAPRGITVSGLTIADKIYDGTTAGIISGTGTFGGAIPGDNLTINVGATTVTFADKNVGTNKAIALTGVTLAGADAANYTAATPTGITGSILPKEITVTGATAASRVYNATTVATLAGGTLVGLVGADQVTLNPAAAVGAFADKNVGTAKPVTATGYALAGADAANYSVKQPTGLTASITPFTLGLLGVSANKTYDGTTAAPLAFTGLGNVFVGDVVTVDPSGVTGTFADKNAGTAKAVTLAGAFGLTGADAKNYQLTQPTGVTGTVAPRGITVSGLTIADKTYDGTVTGVISGTGTFGGTITGDDLRINVGAITVAFADKNAGTNKAVTLSGVTLAGADAANYTATTPTGITASILPKDVSVTGLGAANKIYDGTAAASLTGLPALQGTVSGDSVSLNAGGLTGSFANKNVGTGKAVAVTGLTLGGGDAANYRLTVPALSASITPRDVSVGGIAVVSRVYDGTTTATLSGTAQITNLVSGDAVNFSPGALTASFADKNAGANKPVAISGAGLTGTDAANYRLAPLSGLTGSITPAELRVTGTTAANKTYDGTAAATLTAVGTVAARPGDAVQLGGTPVAAFADKNAGTNKPVTLSGYTLTGADAANYTLVPPTNVTATISRATLALTGVVADSKIYDGTTAAPLSGSLTVAALARDNVTVAGTPTATFADKNVGPAKAVTLTGLSLAGPDAANYTFVLPSLSASITPRNLQVGGLTVLGRAYDGTTAATLSGTVQLTGAVAGDAISYNAAALTATFADKNAGTAKRVTLSGNGLSGADAGNYVPVLPTNLVSTITARALQVLGVDAVNRAYDRTTVVALTGGTLGGVVAGDAVTLSAAGATGTMADKNAGVNKAVVVSGYALGGTDAANYTVAQPTGVDVTITAVQVGITGVEVADKLFDGTTNATISGGTLNGALPGDDLRLVTTGATARFDTALVGNDKAVSLDGFTLAGSDAGNYRINPSLSITGRILPSLREISEVVPAEVLRAASNQALETQRAQLEAQARAQADPVKVTDFSRVVQQATAGIVITPINRALLDTPPAQQDPLTKNYIAAAMAVDAANNNLQAQAIGFRIAADQQKQTGQQLNQTVKALQVEQQLRAPLVQRLEQVNSQLALADRNLAAIADAKRNIADYTQRLADAARLGRGSEVAEYQRIIDAAKGIVATEARTLEQRAALAKEAESSREKIAAAERRISELDAKQAELTGKLAEVESRLANVREGMADAKAKAAAAAAKLAEAQTAGERAFASDATRLQQADSLKALAASEHPAQTAAKLVQSDPFVQQFEAKAVAAKEVTATLGKGLADTLSPQTLTYAQSLAEKINGGGVLDGSKQMRDSLVQSVPALRDLQSKVAAAEQRQQQETARMEALLQGGADTLGRVVNLTPQQKAEYVAQQRARLNDRLNQLTGGALDLSKVPTTNADGKVLTELERISIAILNKQLTTPQGQAAEAGQFVAGYTDRLNSAVAAEFGFSPKQALNDPRVLANEVENRVPFNRDGLDKEKLAENLKTAASAYVNLNGALKDEAIKQAATQDPTGAAQAYVGAENAARAEFVKSYGAQPEDVITSKINARIDAYKNADSPEALLRVHAASMVPGGEMTIEAATKAFSDLKAGKSPDAVVKDMATSLWNGNGDGPSAREQAAQAGKTAIAARDAAIASLEESDKTGLFKASNAVTGAAGAEFAKTFGGSPQELGIKAIEDPSAAANQIKNVAKDVFTTPDGAANLLKSGVTTYFNMADATLNAAKQQLDVVAQKLGGPGEAAAFVLKHGITAATKVGDFLQDTASTLTGGLIPKSGPSKAEVEAAVAYAKAQEAVAVAESQKREDAMLLQYFQAAQDLAKLKSEMAVGVLNAKAQVGQYLVASQQQAKQEQTAVVAKATVTAEITRAVQTGLNEKAQEAQAKVATTGLSTEEMQARAQVWRGGGM